MRRRPSFPPRWIPRLLWLLLLPAVGGARDKTDIIVLNNGDRFTGEIKQLEYGKLLIGTDDAGTLSIEWTAIAKLTSVYTFDIELIGGTHYFGTLAASAEGRHLIVSQLPEPIDIAMVEVSRISQLESGWLQRINGSFSVGFNFAKSSDISVLTGHFDATYRAPRVVMGLRIDSTSTTSPEEGTLDRQSVAYTYQWIRPQRRFWAGLTSYERNEELGINGRVQLGGAFGYYLRQAPTSEVTAMVGIVDSNEWVEGEAGSTNSVEGLLGITWRVFRFSSPETSLNASMILYPSLTESKRVRSAVNLSLRREIVEDFYIDLSTYYDYDSQPPAASPAKDDYGIVTSLGYSF